jgi:hypothetical protein
MASIIPVPRSVIFASASFRRRTITRAAYRGCSPGSAPRSPASLWVWAAIGSPSWSTRRGCTLPTDVGVLHSDDHHLSPGVASASRSFPAAAPCAPTTRRCRIPFPFCTTCLHLLQPKIAS